MVTSGDALCWGVLFRDRLLDPPPRIILLWGSQDLELCIDPAGKIPRCIPFWSGVERAKRQGGLGADYPSHALRSLMAGFRQRVAPGPPSPFLEG